MAHIDPLVYRIVFAMQSIYRPAHILDTSATRAHIHLSCRGSLTEFLRRTDIVDMSDTPNLSLTSTVHAVKEQVSRDLAGEAVILHMTSGVYYGLDAVGARIWDLVQTPGTVQKLLDTVLAEYDVDPKRAEDDLFELLRRLASEGLLEVHNAVAI